MFQQTILRPFEKPNVIYLSKKIILPKCARLLSDALKFNIET